ncbi:MAG: M20 family metallopeptidase [bacterium]
MSVAERIYRAVDEKQAEIVKLLRKLVQIPTPTPPGLNYDRIVEIMLPYFTSMGFQARRIDLPEQVFHQRCKAIHPELEGARSNLLANFKKGKKETVLWYAHIDTVPVNESRWTIPPYRGLIKDGRIWGRGTSDNKGGCAAVIAAFRILYELGLEPKSNVVVALTSDEEVGPYSGLMYLADEGYFKDCQYFHCLDGSSEGIGIGANGTITWSLTIKGESAHSGESFLGINPIEHSFGVLEQLLKLKGKVELRKSRMPVAPKIADETGMLTVIPLLNITMARGGLKHNIVPSEFILEGDRRLIPEEEESQVIREIQDAVNKAQARDPKLKYELKTTPSYPSFFQDPNHPWVQKVKRAAELVSGEKLSVFGSGGSTDVAYIVKATQMKVASYGTSRHKESGIHGENENVRIGDLLNLVKCVAILATELA